MEQLWMKYKIQWQLRKRLKLYNKEEYAEQKILEMDDANQLIARFLERDVPFCLLRLGFAECRFVVEQLRGEEIKIRKNWKDDKFANGMGANFKTAEENIRYIQMVLEHIGMADIMAYWNGLEMEDYLIVRYAPKAIPINAVYLEPIEVKEPWTMCLEGKKVLIISPFAKEIIDQYQKIDLIYQGKKLWPEMNLKTLKSIWYPNNDFISWFDAMDYLFNEAMKIDFDVVLLSCGPFGFDLAARFKQAGKQAIHMGGCLQMLFGIMGSRWDNNAAYSKYVNEHWIRAPKTEMPQNAEQLDQACYW